jgi:signal peptidase II
VAAAVVALDQSTKSVVESHLGQPVHLLGPLGLGLAYNSGSAFSIFPGHPVVIGVIGAIVVAVLVWCAWRTRRIWVAVALGLVLGGAIGNLADRVVRGHHGAVVDFITLSHWPTFNVADATITVGVIALAILLWRRR